VTCSSSHHLSDSVTLNHRFSTSAGSDLLLTHVVYFTAVTLSLLNRCVQCTVTIVDNSTA